MNHRAHRAWQVHEFWFIRAALVLLVTVCADAAVGWFAARPSPWIVLIPGSLPLSMYIFVALPIVKQAERDS